MAANFRGVVQDIGLGAEHALFFAGEKHEAHGAARHQAQRLKTARDVDHHGGVHAIVLRAGAQVPGVQMGADQHDFLRPLAAPYFRHHISGLNRRPPMRLGRSSRTRTSPCSERRANRAAWMRATMAAGRGRLLLPHPMGWR